MPARAAKVLERAVRDLNFRGGYIGTNVNGNYYGTEEFDPFWAKAQELDVMVVMHPEDVAGADKMNPYGLKLICGNPADSALCFGFMTYSGVFDRFPEFQALHPPRRRLLPLSSRPLRPRLGSPRRRARRKGEDARRALI